MRDKLLNTLLDETGLLRHQMIEFKQRAVQQIGDSIDLSTVEYNVNYFITKGNVTLNSVDSERCVRKAVDEYGILISVFKLERQSS
ncbi:MAG: DUF3164 family protein [Sodalis sp. (in: enterobacteria)]